jgi:hypothetical protein
MGTGTGATGAGADMGTGTGTGTGRLCLILNSTHPIDQVDQPSSTRGWGRARMVPVDKIAGETLEFTHGHQREHH